jgi:SAM-dependent methyltransferase
MHPTAMQNCAAFFKCYGAALMSTPTPRVIDIGAQDVNGSLRQVVPPEFAYVGVDFVSGKGVDIVLDDPYALPFASDSAEVVISSSCFEHSEMFWVLFLEILRILKPGGLFYLNAPSNGDFHRWPVDCWRFYPDSGRALVTWAIRNGVDAALLESYTSFQNGDQWSDFIAVFVKGLQYAAGYPDRILNSRTEFDNGLVFGNEQVLNFTLMPEDRRKLTMIGHIVADRVRIK